MKSPTRSEITACENPHISLEPMWGLSLIEDLAKHETSGFSFVHFRKMPLLALVRYGGVSVTFIFGGCKLAHAAYCVLRSESPGYLLTFHIWRSLVPERGF